MTAVTENDLKRLEDLIIGIANGQKAIENRLTTIETGQKNLEVGQSDIRGDIRALDAKIGGLSDRVKVLENAAAKTVDLAEKVGELKNWRSIAFLILGAIAGWIARNSMINNP